MWNTKRETFLIFLFNRTYRICYVALAYDGENNKFIILSMISYYAPILVNKILFRSGSERYKNMRRSIFLP